MVKHRVLFETKAADLHLINHHKDFDTLDDACTFFREIKGRSVTKPIIEVIEFYGDDTYCYDEY